MKEGNGKCFNPIDDAEGLCMTSQVFEKVLKESSSLFQDIHTAILADQIENVADEKFLKILNQALGTTDENGTDLATLIVRRGDQVEDTILSTFENQQEHLMDVLRATEDSLNKAINEQCPATPTTKATLPKDAKKMLKEKVSLEEAKRKSADYGVGGEHVDQILEDIIDTLIENEDMDKETLKKWMKDAPAMSELKESDRKSTV